MHRLFTRGSAGNGDDGREQRERFPCQLVVLFVILAVGLGLVGNAFYDHQQAHAVREQQGDLAAVADLKVQEIVNWRHERLGDAAVIREDRIFARRVREFFAPHPAPDVREDIARRLAAYPRFYGYSGAVLFDARGRVRLAAGEAWRDVPQARAFVLAALRDRQVRLSDLERGGAANDIRLAVFAPLLLPAGGRMHAIGVVMLSIDPRRFLFPLIRKWPKPSRTAETLLVRREGDQVLFLNELRHRSRTALSLRLPIARETLPAAMAVRGRRGIVMGRDYRDVPVVAAIRAVPDTPWFMISKVDQDEIAAPLRNAARTTALVVLLALFSSGAGIALFWRRQQLAHYRRQASVEARYRSTLDAMMEGCQILGFDWTYRYVNDAAAKHGRKTKEELLGSKITDLYPGIDETPLFAALRQCRDERLPLRMENEFAYPDGSKGWFDLSIQPSPEGVFILSVDVTARKRAELQLAVLNRELDQRVRDRTAKLESVNKELEGFSYSVSHDLRAPLRHLTGFVELLLKRAASLDEKSRHYLEVISGAATQMGRLIDDLLTFSRMGRTEMLRSRVDLRHTADVVIRELGVETKDRDVRWRIGRLPEVAGDPSMLKLVMTNLLANAVKFTRTRTPAIIELGSDAADDGQVVVFIRDNGVGFDMRYEQKLFTLFQRLHRQEEFEGTGVGLANVRRIIHRHGGRTWARGAVGEGATFFFSLPAGTGGEGAA